MPMSYLPESIPMRMLSKLALRNWNVGTPILAAIACARS